MRKLPIGIQSFEDLRRNDYVYVDKTAYIDQLEQNGKSYFLSRPRRFGKSLFLSTLDAYFSGKNELFEGLEAYTGKGLESYPVIHFDLSSGEYNRPNGLSDRLNDVLENCIRQYDLHGDYEVTGETLTVRFGNVIEMIYQKTGRQVVVLVDEYDKPLLDVMEMDEHQSEDNRILFRQFFSNLKSKDSRLKFVFITGITKFSKVSIFSDMNQLNDISMDDRYAGICGITEEELHRCFKDEISQIAEANDESVQECRNKLAQMYDGYHFSRSGEGVYNPFSILNAFDKKEYGRYWYSTGTPTFLIHRLEKSDITIENLTEGIDADEDRLENYRGDNRDPVPLFYQSGYLTIRNYDKRRRIYTLSFPNDEVKYGFLYSLALDVIGRKSSDRITYIDMADDLRTGSIEDFVVKLQSMYASMPYHEGKRESSEQEWRN